MQSKSEFEFQLLRYNKPQRFGAKLLNLLKRTPLAIWGVILWIGRFFKKIGIGIGHIFRDLFSNFFDGNWKTRLSYLLMGFSQIFHKQFLRGIAFAAFEIIFIVYMATTGVFWMSQLGTLGVQGSEKIPNPSGIGYHVVYHDNSFKILLYGVLSIFFIVAFIYVWYMNVKQAKILEDMDKENEKIKTDKDDLRALVDRDFYKTLLAMPLAGIIVFMVIPIVFMVLVAFTNFDKNHTPPTNLFGWVGFENFSKLFTWNTGGASFSATFGEILVWTLIWAFFATFTNYFLGMLVALLINKKGIKLKKMWRTILVLTITIPQFISLLYVSKMFGENGIINKLLMDWHWISSPIPFWKDANLARVTVIIINIWIGVPYLMLMVTGILMNIPADLYESAKIDGASPMQQYMKITLPYMLFVTGPYLLTSFTGNMNNFNVIYLLTGGGPANSQKYLAAGDTNLLITWLYSTTVSDNNYSLAAVIGIMVFVIVAIITGVVYNLLPSNKNEDDLA